VKEGKSRLQAVFRVAVVGGVLITAAVVALYTPWLPIFDLREIAVSGYRRTTADEIARSTQLYSGQPLLTIPLRTVAARVSLLPWVKDVAVERVFPHGIRIRVEERAPVAKVALREGNCLTLGEEGIVVEVGCEFGESLAEITGAVLSGETPGAQLIDSRIAGLVDALHRAKLPGLRIQTIDVSDPGSVVVTAEPGLRILLGRMNETMSRVDRLAALCRVIDVGDYEVIDLRFEGEGTLVPR
jgi:cell division protein FtsQ